MMLMFVPLVFSLLSFVISEDKVILNHINNREFLMLRCNITDDGCCQNMKEVEFFKNGEGVCTMINCRGGYAIPLTRDDTKYYKCGCVEREIRNSYLHATKSRSSDFGNWTCGCFDKEGGRDCNSSVMVISKKNFGRDMKNSNQKSTTNAAYLQYLLFFVGFVLAVIIVLVVGIIFLRRCVSKQVILTRPTRLTAFLFGKKENAEESYGKKAVGTATDKLFVTPNDNQPTFIPLLTPNDNQHGTNTPTPLVTPNDNQHGTTTPIQLVTPNDNQHGTTTPIQLVTPNNNRHGTTTRLSDVDNAVQREAQSLLDIETIQNDIMKNQDGVLPHLVKEFMVSVLNATCNVANKPDWCGCGKCRNMKEQYHSVCCRDRGVVFGCFSQSQDFLSKCLSKEAIYKFKQSIDRDESSLKPYVAAYLKSKFNFTVEENNDDVPDVKQTNKWFREISYFKCKEILPVSEKEMFTAIPSCCLLAIREVFPDSEGIYEI